MNNYKTSIPKALICAIIILFLSVLGAWLYALSGGFQEIIYVLGGITIAFWVCLYILVYKFSQNKMFSYIIWFYFISSALLGTFMFFDVDVPRIFGICFFILFVSVWVPIAYAPEYIMRLFNENNVFVTNKFLLYSSTCILFAVFVIIYFVSRLVKNRNWKYDENEKAEDS